MAALALNHASVAWAEPPAANGQVDGAWVALAADSAVAFALRARLARLPAAARHDSSVRRPLAQAELALRRARIARAAWQEEAAERAEQVADAATSLAERRSALVLERAAGRATAAERRSAEALVAATESP